MANASPAQKARLLKKLISGHTNDKEDRAMASILESCTSKKEYDEVLRLAGGKKKVFGEPDDKSAKRRMSALDKKWGGKQKAALSQALLLLEQAKTPEEARKLADQLGGTSLKHQIKDPALIKRLNAVAKRHKMPALSHGLPPKAVANIRKQIAGANDDAAVKLAESKHAMNIASPAEKAKLIRTMMSGWTKDREDMAIYKILSSCKSKKEFDEVMRLSGGKKVVAELDLKEAKNKLNQLCGAWGRTEWATNKKLAQKFNNVLADPKRRAELGATRPPTAGEVGMAGGSFKLDPKGDPMLAQAGKAMNMAKQQIQKNAYNIGYDQQAQTELVLEQRRREVSGKPKLDWTSLTAQAEKITSDPDLDKKVAAFRKKYNKGRFLGIGKIDMKEAKKKYITKQTEALAKKNGVSKQTMKSLVTQRMGQIYGEAGGMLKAQNKQLLGPLKKKLAHLEKTRGKKDPEVVALRAQIKKIEDATGPYTEHVNAVGDIYKGMFEVPPSWVETFVKVFTIVADIAAAIVSLIPGVGQIIGACYFGVKAIVAAVQGDLLGMFTSVASAIPGVGAAIGGAVGQGVKIAGQIAQAAIGVGKGIASGDVLGVIGGLASAAGGVGGVGGAVGKVANQVSKGLNVAAQAGTFVDGAVRGDVGRMLGGLSGVAGGVGAMAAPGSSLSKAMSYAQKGVNMADGIARGDIGAVVNSAASMAAPHIKNQTAKDVLKYAQKAVPFVDSVARGDLSGALNVVANELGNLPVSGDAKKALNLAKNGIHFADALRAGDYGKALGNLSSGLQGLSGDPTFQKIAQGVGQGGDVLRGIQSGDPAAVLQALTGKDGQGGLLSTMGAEGLSKAMGDMGKKASDLLGSPDFKTVMDVTRSGTAFVQGLANGDLDQSLAAVAGLSGPLGKAVPGLKSTLDTAVPLARAMAKGDFESALGSLAGSPLTQELGNKLGLLEPLSGLAKGTALKDLEGLGRSLGAVASGIARGDTSAILGGIDRSISSLQQAAGPSSPLGQTLGLAKRASALGQGIANGDLGAIGRAAGDLAGPLLQRPELAGIVRNPAVQNVAQAIQKGLPMVQSLANGDLGSTLQQVQNELGGLTSNPAARRALGLVTDGARFANAMGQGDWSGALSTVSGQMQQLGRGSEARALTGAIKQVTDLTSAMGSGNPAQLASALRGGFLDQATSGKISGTFDEVSKLGGRLLESSELSTAMELTRAGSRFFSSVAHGDLSQSLSQVAGLSGPLGRAVPKLSGLLNAGAPLAQAMAGGNFDQALQALGENPATSGIAESMSSLQPLAELASGRALSNLEGLEQSLNTTLHIQDRLDEIRGFESTTRELMERFGGDPMQMANNLLDRSGYLKPPIDPLDLMEETLAA